MRSLNRCTFIGYLGADPEIRSTPNGDVLASARLGVADEYKDKGVKVEKTEWVTLKFQGKLAEIVERYLKKGSRIYAEGKLETRKYTGRDQTEKYAVEIRVTEMQMLDPRHSANEPPQKSHTHQVPSDWDGLPL